MRGVIFPDAIRVRLDADLRTDLLRLAAVEKSTLSETSRRLLRAALRRALAERPAAPARSTRTAA